MPGLTVFDRSDIPQGVARRVGLGYIIVYRPALIGRKSVIAGYQNP
jgi:hypothetical protein